MTQARAVETPTVQVSEPQPRDPVAAHFVQLLLDFLSGRRDLTVLKAFCSEPLCAQLTYWRRTQPAGVPRLVGLRGVRTSPRMLEASFSLAWPGRQETFTLRLEQKGARWSCVHLASLRPLPARVPPFRTSQRVGTT